MGMRSPLVLVNCNCAMTVLKWIAIILATGYLAGVAALYVKQRDMLFPVPPVGRTAPDAAGLPEAEEHVLTTSDGEKVILWHVPANVASSLLRIVPVSLLMRDQFHSDRRIARV